VLEEYTVGVASPTADSRSEWEGALKALLPDEPVWKLLEGRLAIVPDGIFSFFVQSACEVAQHVSINDETGTARAGALFNQENCPPETLFYGMIAAQRINGRDPKEAFDTLGLLNGKALQIGAGETTGLGWCTFACSFTKADADTEVK
jgi:CRISPR-associated protein Cmr4